MKVPIGTNIYLKFGRKIKIPVNPSEIEIKRPSKNKTFEVLDKGEIVVPMPAGLTEVSWESFFTEDTYAPYVDGGKSVRSIIKSLEKAKKNRTKGRLIINRSDLFDTNMTCIIEDFTTKDKGGEPNDIYYSITLKEYRNYAPETVAIAEPISPSPEAVLEDTGVETSETQQVTAVVDRPVETPVMRVGAIVIANGTYCNDSYGSKPHGTANNIQTTVNRIVAGRAFPILIGSYGWITEAQLQVIG